MRHRGTQGAARRGALFLMAGLACSSPAEMPTTGGISGLVTGAGAPLAGVEVGTVPATGFAASDTAGAWRIDGVPAGTYTLSASKAGWRTASREGVVVAAGGQALVDLDLAADAVAGTLTGHVRAQGGAGIAGAFVTTEPATTQAATGSDGAYTLCVAAGTYVVEAGALGYEAGASAATAVGAGATVTVNLELVAVVTYGTTCAECHLKAEKLLADLAIDPPPDATGPSGSAGEG